MHNFDLVSIRLNVLCLIFIISIFQKLPLREIGFPDPAFDNPVGSTVSQYDRVRQQIKTQRSFLRLTLGWTQL